MTSKFKGGGEQGHERNILSKFEALVPRALMHLHWARPNIIMGMCVYMCVGGIYNILYVTSSTNFNLGLNKFLIFINIINFVFSSHKKRVTCFGPYKKIQHILIVLEKFKFCFE